MTRIHLAVLLALGAGCVGGDPEGPGGAGDGARPPADCDDPARPAWLDWRELVADEDGDGYGYGPVTRMCLGVGETPDSWVPAGGAVDCAPADAGRWSLRPYAARDADSDGLAVADSGEICSGHGLPPGYLDAVPPGAPDCADSDPDAWRLVTLFDDRDEDGFGAGAGAERCIGADVPAGQSTLAGDCAPNLQDAWALLDYSHRDADGDGARVPEDGQVCSGPALPPGYAEGLGAGGLDCDDGDPLRFRTWFVFADADGDGFGAGDAESVCAAGALPAGVAATGGDCAPDDAALHTPLLSYVDADGDGVGAGDAATLCTGGTRPPGFSAEGGDCAASDAARWRLAAYGFVDRDGDGRTVAESGQLCTGQVLPPPYRTAASGNDCDDAEPALLGWAVLYADGDGDGVGAGPRSITCVGGSPPAGLSVHGDDADDEDPLLQTDEDDEDELDLLLS